MLNTFLSFPQNYGRERPQLASANSESFFSYVSFILAKVNKASEFAIFSFGFLLGDRQRNL